MPARIPIVVVGTGFGVRTQVPGFQACGRFEVVALVGRDPTRTAQAAARRGIARTCRSLAEALAIPGVQAVSITTPPASHAPLVLEAVRAGKHVLCEKPMACSVGEAEAMRAAVAAAGVAGLVDHEFRFHPGRAMLGRIIARGDLGTPTLVTAVDQLPLYVAPHRPAPDWWFDAAAGGGWLGASGSHLIDAVRVWTGEITALAAQISTLAATEPRRTADDTFALLLRTESGTHATLQQSAAVFGPRVQLLRVAGTEGTAWLDEQWTLWRVGRGGEPETVPADADLAAPTVDIPPGAGPFAARELPSFVRQAERFADAITGARAATDGDPPAATFADGLAVQRVIDAAHESSVHGRWVRLPPGPE